jgi:hypothetical protein
MDEVKRGARETQKFRWFTLRTAFIIISACVCLGLLLLFLHSFGTDEARRLETIDIGNDIVHALNLYYSDQGQYPDALEPLVPKYLKQIRAPKWGEEWQYKVFEADEKKSFWLEVGYKRIGNTNNYPVMYYTPQTGWVVDT